MLALRVAFDIVAVIKLIDSRAVQAIIGTITVEEAALFSDIDKTIKDFPIVSLTSPAMTTPMTSRQLPYFIQMSSHISLHM